MIVIGLDGLDPGLVEAKIGAGELPNLARLRERGGLARVGTTAPAQTPVAWSTFATGTNPGGHGIFDFLRRDPATYLPDLALNRYERKNAFTAPRAVNLRHGTPVWDVLTRAGIPSTILRCPCTYPPDNLRGRMLSGMGVPDLRGGLGSATFLTTADDVTTAEGEHVEILRPAGSEHIHSGAILGPRNARGESARLELRVAADLSRHCVAITCPGLTPERLDLEAGRWSTWVKARFKLGALQAVHGMVRFRLLRTEPHLELYASPVNFDPESPLFPISSPPGFAGELAADLGPYYTTGMVEDHAGLSNGRLDEAAFLDQCDEVWEEREAMMLRELERFDEGLFYCLFDTPDRVQHLFWRHREPDHPANRERPACPGFARVVDEQYERADAVVAGVLPYVDDSTLLIAMSDHGFGTFRRGVDLNAWLHQQGLLHLRDGRAPGTEAGEMLQGIDWSRTRAYALGLGGIYLNLEGREAQGIVRPDEAPELRRRISEGLAGLPDAEHDTVAVTRVDAREAIYSGPCTAEAPDLLVQMARGYRAGWRSSLGGVGEVVLEDNTRVWAGDHIVDPGLVPGVLVMNHSFRGERASLVDLAPTILDALAVPTIPEMEGSALR